MQIDQELQALRAWRKRLDERIAELETERLAAQRAQDDVGYMRYALADPKFQRYLLRKQLNER